jgi:hypothetical protein
MTDAETPEVGGGQGGGISVNPFSDQGGQIMPATLLLAPPPIFLVVTASGGCIAKTSEIISNLTFQRRQYL